MKIAILVSDGIVFCCFVPVFGTVHHKIFKKADGRFCVGDSVVNGISPGC